MLTVSVSIERRYKAAIKLYDLGVKAFKKNDFKTADSLFTKSAAIEPNADTYFNLASSKLKLGDNCGFCKYIEKSYKIGDINAFKLFNSKCFTYDTTFYKNMNNNDINHYYSVVASEKCTKNKEQTFYIEIQDSVKYSFVFIDSAYEKSIRTFNKFPNIDSNLSSILFYLTDEVASFGGGGVNKINEFLNKNLIYPKEAKENDIQGTVYVSFIIDETGSIKNIKIANSVHEVLDKEALRVVHLMNRWLPGKFKNKPVKVSFVLPIKFLLL